MKTFYCATGEEMQQWFESFEEAKDAAKKAPWADGNVFAHHLADDEIPSGYGEIGGEFIGNFQ